MLELVATESPVPVAEAELLDSVTGLRVSAGAEEDVVEPVAEEDCVEVLVEEVVVELLVVDDEDTAFWTRLHLTIED